MSSTNHPKRTATRKKPNKPKVKTGHVGSFLQQRIHETSVDADLSWIGEIPSSTANQTDSPQPLTQQLDTICTFLKRHQAILTLNNTPYYETTLEDFAATQLEQQAAGLQTTHSSRNTNETTATDETTKLIVQAHEQVLIAALEDAKETQYLSAEQLQSWHTQLMAGSTLKNAGRYRTNGARVGTTSFCLPRDIPNEMNALLEALQVLPSRWSLLDPASSSCRSSNSTHVYYAIALAATALFGVIDIHPFSDGNGRMGRLCCNWILTRYLGLPFAISFASTRKQRTEMITALRHGVTSTLQLMSNTTATQPEETSPALRPLIQLIVERIEHAVQQLERRLSEKAKANTLHEQARMAVQARERTAAGNCIICLESNPDIATLCCGQAVHLNCLAEWLVNQSSCVHCRSELPPMKNLPSAAATPPPAVQASLSAPSQDVEYYIIPDIDNEEVVLEYVLRSDLANANQYSTMCILCNQNRAATDCHNHMCGNCCPSHHLYYLCTRHFEGGTTEEDDEDEDNYTTSTTEEHQPVSAASPLTQCTVCSNRAALDCDNQMCGRCCPQSGNDYCVRHAPEEEEEDTTTESDSDEDAEMTVLECQICSNRAADECSNQMCGRCCPSSGNTYCARHAPEDDPETEEDTTTESCSPDNNHTAVFLECQSCSNRAAEDCNYQMCGNCCPARSYGSSYPHCYRHSPEEDTTTTESYSSQEDDDTTTVLECQNCNNLAAKDCTNQLCSRCCSNSGRNRCSRHSS